MEFVPRHKHPFTWDELMELDVVEITQGNCDSNRRVACRMALTANPVELSRLQDSLQRLQDTQKELQDYLITDPDPDIRSAFEGNVGVM